MTPLSYSFHVVPSSIAKYVKLLIMVFRERDVWLVSVVLSAVLFLAQNLAQNANNIDIDIDI